MLGADPIEGLGAVGRFEKTMPGIAEQRQQELAVRRAIVDYENFRHVLRLRSSAVRGPACAQPGRQETLDRPDEGLRVDGLGQVAVETRVQHVAAITRHGQRGYGDDGNRAQQRIFFSSRTTS